MVRWSLMVLAGCGRFGFAPAEGSDAPRDSVADDGIDAPRDSPGPDAPPDAAIDAPPGAMTFTFGEAPLTMFNNVTQDTYIRGGALESTLNYGADTEVRIERDANERALIRFDLGAVPAGATIFSAMLDLTVTQTPSMPSKIDLHRVLELWDEGAQNDTPGQANYSMRTSSAPWSTPGAGPTLSSTVSFGQYVPADGRVTIPIPASVIDAWMIAGSNFGLVMISTNDSSTRLTTKEGTPSTDRPVLTITFVP